MLQTTHLCWTRLCCHDTLSVWSQYFIVSAAAQLLDADLCAWTCRANGGSEAASLRIAEQYLEAFRGVAKQSTTLLLPADTSNPASMVAQAMGIFRGVTQGR